MMQTAGGIKNRKRRQQKLQDVLTKTEEDIQITSIQSLDLEVFAAMIETIDMQTVDTIQKSLDDSLELHFKTINSLSPENKTKQLTDILAFRELIRNYKKILNIGTINDDLKEPMVQSIRAYGKKVDKIIDKVVSIRENLKQREMMETQNFIGIAVLNIKEKILKYASPEDNTASENLRRTLNSLVIGLKARVEDLERSDVIKTSVDGKIYIKGPSIAKFFNRNPALKIDRTIAEHQINCILDLYSLLSSLKLTIRTMPNIKRTHLNIHKNTEKYNKVAWEKMIEKLDDIVTNASHDMAHIFVKNIPKLLTQNKNNYANIFADPYLKESDRFLYIHDALEEINSAILRSYSKSHENAYKLLVESMYSKWSDSIFPLLKGKRAERLLLVNAVKGLMRVEQKINVPFVMLKQKLAQHPVTALLVKEQQQQMRDIDKILGNKVVNTKTVDIVNSTLNDILSEMEVKPKVEVKVEKIKHSREEYDKFIGSLKDTNELNTLQHQIIKYYYNKYGTKLDLSFYQNCLHSDYQTRFLLHISGFFRMYANIYGHYSRDFFQDMGKKNNSFYLWRMTRVDNGKLITVYTEFVKTLINHGFVLFRNEKFEVKSLSDDNKNVVNNFFNNVNEQYNKIVELNEKVRAVSVETTAECPHVVVEEKLNRAYDLLEVDPDNKVLQDELNELLAEKQECTIESSSAILCKHCNVQLEVIISAEPASFDDAQDLIANQQKELLFDALNQNEEIANEFNAKVIQKYMDIYLNLLNFKVVKEVSSFSNEQTISEEQVANVKKQINRIVSNSDKVIFNNARSFFTKKTRISSDTMKTQLTHDIIKFLVIFFLVREGDEGVASQPNDLQSLFHKVQSFQTFIDKTLLNKEVRLNYTIRTYNLSLDILRTAENFTYERDSTNITEDTLDTLDNNKLIIVSQEFNLKQNNLAEIKKQMAAPNEIVDIPLDLKAISGKLMKSLNTSYQEILNRLEPAIFKTSGATDLLGVLESYILLSEKKENIRMMLKQNNLNVKKINSDIEELNKKISIWNIPSEKLFMVQRRDSLVQLLEKHEQDKAELQNKTKQLEEDKKIIEQIEPIVNSLSLPLGKMNIVNLYQHVLYHSRPENINETNPHISAYNKAHDKTKIYEELQQKFNNLDHRLLLKYIRGLFMNRYNLLNDANRDLEFLHQIQTLGTVLDKKGSLTSIVDATGKKHFIYESKVGVVRLEHSFIELVRNNLKVGSLALSYNALNSLLASPAFMIFADKVVNFDLEGAVQTINKELKSYKNTFDFFQSLNDTVYLCPVCDKSDTHNINVKHHLSSHHISTNDNLKTIQPMGYMVEMDWFEGKSKQVDGYICPYCPYRGSSQQIYKHIRENHMNLKDSIEAFKMAETRRYYAHLELLYNNNKSEYDKSLEAGTIQFSENKELFEAAQMLDNIEDMTKYYVLFCDQNVDTMTTMRHVYRNGVCVHCQRSIARVHQDANQGDKPHVAKLVKMVEKRLKELNDRYCLLNHVSELTKDPCKKKKQMVENMLNGKDTVLLNTLLSSDVSWELKKTLDHVPFRVAKHLTDVVEHYKRLVRNDYAGSVPFDMASLDDIDEVHVLKQSEPSAYYRQYQTSYLNYLASPYRILSKDAKNKIFHHPSVVKIDEGLRKHSQNQKGDPIEYNKKMGDMIEQLRKQISMQAKLYLEDLAGSSSFAAFAQDITAVLGRSDSEAYTDILQNLNSQHMSVFMSDDVVQEIVSSMQTNRLMNNTFIEETANKIKDASGSALTTTQKQQRNFLKYTAEWRYIESLLSLPTDLLFQLRLLTSGQPRSYRRQHYVLAQKKK